MLDMNTQFTKQQLDRVKKIGKKIGYIALIIGIILLGGVFTFSFLTEYIWMDSLGFSTVFTTVFKNRIVLVVIGFLLFALSSYFTLFWIRRSYLSHFSPAQLPALILDRKIMTWIMISISIIVGLIGSSLTQGLGWERMLKFIHHTSFGQTDPHFNLDISFYIFVLPFLKFIISLLLSLAIFFLIVQIGAYSVFEMYRVNRSAQIQMGVTLALIGLLLASVHILAPYETLLTNSVNIFQNSVVHGISYTDDLINIPKAYILAAVAVIGTVWMIVALARGSRLESVVAPIAIYIVLVVVGQLVSVGVQNFIVSPNEFTKERPYLERNLELTRSAYELDEINEMEHPGNQSLSKEMVERNKQTIDNIRINDVQPLFEVYNQTETFRTYYNYHDIDVDRYEIDGSYEQVFIGARELSTDNLPDQAQTWVNRYLRYTHGYGVTMSHVNQITSQGQPRYMIKDIPPEGVLDITRPQIYFGEGKYPNVIANSKVEEFDYPLGDENVSSRFEADTGIDMNMFNRFLFAIKEGSFRLIVSDQITEESQFLETRNIKERVNRIAPFFEYDKDPYIFVREDGSLAWMLDAYLTAENYPYSEPYQGDKSYIRNSVKVVIDAYTGEVDYYVVTPDDPLLQTYHEMFPDLFTKEVPEDIQKHFRYPERLFSIQASMYGTYHMSNLEVFYNREDFWEFPTEKYINQDVEMRPYYITMKLEESEEEEFILMIPYTPKKRQNMIAWIGVRNDGEHYGEMFVHQFPKQKNIYGPQQIENRINQDSDISKELNLWSQGGSEVIRGNLIAIPIEDTVFYIEPIYIQSSNETSLPEVKQVVLAYGEEIVMEPTFDEALDKMMVLMGLEDGEEVEEVEVDDEEVTEEDDNQENMTPEDLQETEEILREFAELFDAYQAALAEGKWEEAGKIMTEIEEKLTRD